MALELMSAIGNLLDEESYRGFPIISSAQSKMLLGYITRGQLRAAICEWFARFTEPLLSDKPFSQPMQMSKMM